MSKSQQLEKIAEEIAKCKICQKNKHGLPVPGEGNPDADVMFIGEAPGRNEAETGRPFIGRSGKLLREAIRGLGLTEEEVYITSPVKYLPDYVTPTDEDIAHGMTHLSKQMEVINPKVMVLLGSVAVRGVLGEKQMISKVHGTVIKKDERSYFISYHPAAAIRFQKFRKTFLDDFQKIPLK
ncbi:MAG TPA: uracil-DNA glycosylase [Patescibacteria group bacterium]|nr:uracil-DNA glycosylase [Patescibacteria group bacterium]